MLKGVDDSVTLKRTAQTFQLKQITLLQFNQDMKREI